MARSVRGGRQESPNSCGHILDRISVLPRTQVLPVHGSCDSDLGTVSPATVSAYRVEKWHRDTRHSPRQPPSRSQDQLPWSGAVVCRDRRHGRPWRRHGTRQNRGLRSQHRHRNPARIENLEGLPRRDSLCEGIRNTFGLRASSRMSLTTMFLSSRARTSTKPLASGTKTPSSP